MKSKVAAILLIFCLSFPVVATFTYLHYQKKVVRKTVKHRIIDGIDRTELVLLKFTKTQLAGELRWEHSKEFEYLGHMYDVIEKADSGGVYYYWCWPDDKETQLNITLNNLVTKILGNNPQRKEKRDNLNNFYKKIFYEDIASQLISPTQKRIHNFLYLNKICTIYFSPSVPPPRIS